MSKEKGYSLAHKSLFIAIPCYDHKVGVNLAFALAELQHAAISHGISVQLAHMSGCSILPKARNLLVDNFMKSGCDHLMFLDADMGFRPEHILRLMAFNQEPEHGVIVAAGVTRKVEEKTYAVDIYPDEAGNIVMNDMGLLKVKRAGTGFMMIRRDVLQDMQDQHPEWKIQVKDKDALTDSMYCFFDFAMRPEGYTGEDYIFCERVYAAGHEVWLDPTIELQHSARIELSGAFGPDILYKQFKPKLVVNG